MNFILWKKRVLVIKNKDIMIAQLTKEINEKKQKFRDKQIRVANGKKMIRPLL